MNVCIITGRLTADPELKTGNNGKYFTAFTIASDKFVNGEKKADFIRCKTWDKTAEKLCQYKRKGDMIGVHGALRVDEYQAQDGTNRRDTYISAVNVEFLGSRQEQPAPQQVTFTPQPAPAEPVFDPVPDDDRLPF